MSDRISDGRECAVCRALKMGRVVLLLFPVCRDCDDTMVRLLFWDWWDAALRVRLAEVMLVALVGGWFAVYLRGDGSSMMCRSILVLNGLSYLWGKHDERKAHDEVFLAKLSG